MDALFIAWSEDRRSGSPQPLKTWVARYPNYADALTRWAADAPAMDWAEAQPADTNGEESALAIGRGVVAEMRARYTVARPAPLAGLLEAAKAQGLTLKTFAQRLQVGLSVAAKLDNRLLQYATLPQTLIQRIADTLQVSVGQVRATLQQPPTLSAGASYRADDVPQVAEPQDFEEAVRSCLDMTEEEKALWL